MSASSSLSRRRLLGLGAAAGAAVLLPGCDSAAGPASTPRRSTAATEPVTVRTCVYERNHAASPLYWQQFAPENYTIEVTTVTSPTEVQGALESGDLDFGLIGPYSTLIAASEGDLTSRIVGMTARGGVGLIGARDAVRSVADLRGKKVGVPPPSIQVLILTDLLAANGMQLGRDVQGVPLPYADHVAALQRGDIDAFAGTEPLCTKSVVRGRGVRLAEAAGTPVGDFNSANWASARVLAERPDVVREVVRMQKAAAELLTPGGVNDRERWRDLLVTQFDYEVPVFEAVLDDVGDVWRFDEQRVAQLEAAGRMLLEQGEIRQEPDYESLYAREYWDA